MEPKDHGNETRVLAAVSLEWTGKVESNRPPIRFIVHYVHIHPHPKDVLIYPQAGDQALTIAAMIEAAWNNKHSSGYPKVARTGSTLDITYSAASRRHVRGVNQVRLVVEAVSEPEECILEDSGNYCQPYIDDGDEEDLRVTVV